MGINTRAVKLMGYVKGVEKSCKQSREKKANKYETHLDGEKRRLEVEIKEIYILIQLKHLLKLVVVSHKKI